MERCSKHQGKDKEDVMRRVGAKQKTEIGNREYKEE